MLKLKNINPRVFAPQIIMSVIAASFAFSACGGEMSSAELEETAVSELHSGLTLVECRPQGDQTCDRGSSCLSLPVSDRGDQTINACSSGRCYTSRGCGDGFVCRLNHCLAVERAQHPQCPRNAVPGIPLCAEGFAPHYLSRDPICAVCEPVADRCDAGRRPIARGTCEMVLGYFWNGRSCTPLSGCSVVSSHGLFRTGADCARAHAACLPTRDVDRDSRDADRDSRGGR